MRNTAVTKFKTSNNQLVQHWRRRHIGIMYCAILLWVSVLALVILSSEGKDTGSVTIPYDFYNFYPCGSNQYRDSSNFACGRCHTGEEVDLSTVGGDGDYEGCRCAASYFSTEIDCSDVRSVFCFKHCISPNLICHLCQNFLQDASGNCRSLSCTDCRDTNKVSYSDNSGCVTCGPSTLGFSGSRDCKCPTNYVLVEKDLNGAYAAEKSCVECGTGEESHRCLYSQLFVSHGVSVCLSSCLFTC